MNAPFMRSRSDAAEQQPTLSLRRLSIVDSAFLLMERRHIPFHVGGLMLFKPPPGAPPDFALQLAERLRHSTQAAAPFDRLLVSHLGARFWEEDRNFDLAHHFVHLALPRPGRIRELLAMVSRVHSAHLDRAYPLWRTYLIEGLEDGRIAVYSKIHHSLVDGVAALRVLMKTMSADRQESLTLPPPWEIKVRRTSDAPMPVPTAGVGSMAALSALLRGGSKSIPAVARQLRRSWNDHRSNHPDLVTGFSAPRCLLNQKISGSRRFAAQSYATARIRAVGRAFDATSNDVVLAMCGGALRRYLMELDGLPERALIAGVPVSIRRDDSDSGNQVFFALTSLATHLAEAAARLRAVKASMDYNKQRMSEMSVSELVAYSSAMYLPGALNMVTGLVDRRHTLMNVVISHVPGPRTPMYWQGCELTGLYPASIVMDEVGLNITLVSRHDFVDFGLTACRKTVPNVQRLLDHLEKALQELEAAAGAVTETAAAAVRPKPAPRTRAPGHAERRRAEARGAVEP